MDGETTLTEEHRAIGWLPKYTKNVTHVEDFSSIQNLEFSSYQVKVIYEISKLNNSKSSTK